MAKNTLIPYVGPEAVIHLRMLYLDDTSTDLDNLKERVQNYNERTEKTFYIELETIKDHYYLDEKVKTGNFHVVLCDQNMPGRLGISCIKYLKEEYKEIVYVLYTGFGDKDLTDECKKNDIIISNKLDFDSLITKLSARIIKMPKTMSVKDIFFTKVINEIVEDLKNLHKDDSSTSIPVKERWFSPLDLIAELRKDNSEYASEFLINYYEGLNLIKNANI